MSHFMIVSILIISLLNLSWIIKCVFLRNMEPLNCCDETKIRTLVIESTWNDIPVVETVLKCLGGFLLDSFLLV